jgi:hypothetical protein
VHQWSATPWRSWKPCRRSARPRTDNLKIETDTRRVWLARTGVADGEAYDNRVTIEEYDGNRWNITESYEAK